MGQKRLEITVGFFVMLAFAIFFVIVFFVSGFYFLRDGYSVKINFDYIAGLEKGAPVRLAGVRVGEVNKISIVYDNETQRPRVVLDVWVSQETKIKEDADVYIIGTFALSEAHVSIASNSYSPAPFLRDGDSITGVSPVPMEKLMEEGMEIAAMVEDFTSQIGAILGDEKLQNAMRSMILDMSELLGVTRKIIEKEGADISRAIDDVEISLEKARSILETIDEGDGTVGQLIKSDELYEEMRGFIREIKLRPWRLLKKDKAS